MSSIRVELELEDGTFTTRMLHAGETVQQFERNLGQAALSVRKVTESSQGLLGNLRDIAIVAGLARMAISNLHAVTTGWAADIIKTNAEMERLTTLMKGLSTAADPVKDAAEQVKYLRDYAKQAPFALATLTDTFTKMKSTGIDPLGGAMKAVVDGIASFGGGDEASSAPRSR
jgi:phage tail tape-measure protein